MAVVSLPTSVTAAAGAQTSEGTAAAAIAAGEVLYRNSAGRLAVADSDASAAAAAAVGIALNSAATGQPVRFIWDGVLENATGLKAGQVYLLSNVAGDVCEGVADLTEDVSYTTTLGVGLSTTSMRVRVNVGGVLLNLVS